MCFNRTFMELKSKCLCRWQAKSMRVLIVPLWN